MKRMAKMNKFDWAAVTLLIIGGFNWGLVGLFNYNLVEALPWSWLVRTVYVAVGASSVYSIYAFTKN